jgi:hypothetical protein
MARLQILELPEGAADDRPPFVLVVDQYDPQRYILGHDQPEPIDEFDGIAQKIGARAVLVFQETVEIPANQITASPAGHLHLEGALLDSHIQQAVASTLQTSIDKLKDGRHG